MLLRQILQYKVAANAKNSKCLVVNRMSLPNQEMSSLWTLTITIVGVLGLNFQRKALLSLPLQSCKDYLAITISQESKTRCLLLRIHCTSPLPTHYYKLEYIVTRFECSKLIRVDGFFFQVCKPKDIMLAHGAWNNLMPDGQ